MCYECNHRTGGWFNDAFKNWTQQASEMMATANGREYVTITFREIQPLKIIKQIATFALATADFGISPAESRLRRFVLYAFEIGLPSDFQFRTYFNPPRIGEENDRILTTKRLTSSCITADVACGTRVENFAEIGHNPLGYLIHFASPSHLLMREVAELTDISRFGTYGWGEKADLTVTLPVRNPFGPVPGRYAKINGPGTWGPAPVDE
jgi:hypothetical protein